MKIRFLILVLGLAIFAGLGFLKTLRLGPQTEKKILATSAKITRISIKPKVSSPIVVEKSASFTSQDRRKLETLNEILASKNDNDPRLDLSFVGLSAAAKELFRTRYEALNPELRNERGTIVFLLGKNLTNIADLEFLHQVLEETPCRSLSDCKKAPEIAGSEDHHLESVNEVTLAYPQIVALKSLEAYLARNDADPSIAAECFLKLQMAQDSSIPIIARTARDILSRTRERG